MTNKQYKTKHLSASKLKESIIKAHNIVKEKFHTDSNKRFHSLEHTLRVVNTCIFLAKELDAYMDIVTLAAMFHDIGRPEESLTGRCHAEIGSEEAAHFLKQEGLNALIADVCKAIETHRFSKGIEPVTLEAKILQDADALDALGAMGLYRTLGFSFENERDLDEAVMHFHEKLFKLSARMHFPITKKLAMEREKILWDFVDGIDSEKKKTDFNLVLHDL